MRSAAWSNAGRRLREAAAAYNKVRYDVVLPKCSPAQLAEIKRRRGAYTRALNAYVKVLQVPAKETSQ